MKKYLLFLFVLVISCSKDDFSQQLSHESKIVVEGWIEEGDFAQVLLSSSIPITDVVDSTNVLDHVIRSAKITISDGETSEVLRVKNDKNRVPPFVYFGTSLKGEAGKEYSLKIEYLNRVVQAITTIPKSVELKSAEYIKRNLTDTTGYIFVKFDDPMNEKNYYQIATKIDVEEPIFVPSFYGNLDDKNFQTAFVSAQINRGILLFPKTKFTPYFADGDLIFVKLRTQNKDALDFWNSWQNEIVNSRNPIYPSNTSLKSNIEGGIGIWAGYGQSTLTVKTPPKK
ncbi:DUF4249 domain-containing protein [Flavobacterium sp. Fl-77]|uniref:DUF4249 domain-containing protein n=1 Tax=Flavobacterium flavipigmentatum TaxID=2893884 RepID=A0AAJ2S9D4_9FLAO|nr:MULTISPECIES: DUF4249 domain-containing protein [unclassified Flavobacterium]MDX6183575.1 DUF4249 domain-containing protein [Flavobacterium sp. Fl-33]MDX6187023.1 DUF4249 domain-containing protein [Flavobacterium sp. Fl-77]UFH40245.1 DUF4249 domain-containing protein [Flavobacterium sp. F-70]